MMIDDVNSSSTASPSPIMLDKDAVRQKYRTCYYHHGHFCCSKICTIAVLLLFTTILAMCVSIVAVTLDDWAGVSTNPEATLDLNYPKLGQHHMNYIMFNDTIPDDAGALYKYIDASDAIRTVTSRFGLFSHCTKPVKGPRIELLKTPWDAPVCRARADQFQCPIVALRLSPGEPEIVDKFGRFDGCIDLTQKCDGVIDCPSGHDELGCSEATGQCTEGKVQCSDDKPVCIFKDQICDGINDCGMHEDERNCCGTDGYVRCSDGACVMGERCNAKADCFDASDEYGCPMPSQSEQFYTKCLDGQLIEYRHKCANAGMLSFECYDMSDETDCEFDPQPTEYNPGIKSMEYHEGDHCFLQRFTFTTLNSTILEQNYPDKKLREFFSTYEFSTLKLAIIVCLFIGWIIAILCIILLLCMGRVTKRCKPLRYTFIVMSVMYSLCLIQTVITGIFWIKYTRRLNNVMENPTIFDIYEQVTVETMQVTGGLASIRISTHLTFYNTGFYVLALILSTLAAYLLKEAPCHTQASSPEDYAKHKGSIYSDETVTPGDLMLPPPSHRDRADSFLDGVPTPEQSVVLQRSPRPHHPLHPSTSDSFLRSYSNHQGNSYISYDQVDSLSNAERLSHTSGRTAKSTQV